MKNTVSIDIGISHKDREEIVKALSTLLADTSVLYSKTHGFHWNVTGKMFNTLHLMFEDHYTLLWESLDEIAERIRALGFMAPFGAKALADISTIRESIEIPVDIDMVRELVSDHEAVAKTARNALLFADKANDQPTADLLTQRLQFHEKTAWMLRSILQ